MNARSSQFARALAARSGAVVVAALLVTGALAVPFLAMHPEGFASQEPGGEVFDARDRVSERFVSAAFDIPFIVEARDGDLLRREPLLELLRNGDAVRADRDVGPKLFTYYDPRVDTEVHGMYSLADAVDDALRAGGVDGIDAADDAQIKAAGSRIIEAAGPGALGLSGESRADPATGDWVVPAQTVIVLGDDAAVGGPPAGVTIGVDDTTKEEFGREVQTLLRGDEVHNEAWGVALAINLTSAEQGEAAGPFIGFTILGVLLIVGLTYRSYWPVAISGAALAAIVIWLRGLSNLVGLESDQILSTIVPIAMISFGIDFAIHAFSRYREEKAKGLVPRAAFAVGLGGVVGALVLALSSDAAAFLSNTAAGIQSIVQFGIAAAFGLFAAFVMLGLVAPLVLMRVEERVGRPRRSLPARAAAVVGSLLAAAMTMSSVLMSVFLSPPAGLSLFFLYVVVFLVLPYLLANRWSEGPVEAAPAAEESTRGQALAGTAIAGVARFRLALLPVVAVVTAVCAYFALQVPAQFDVQDFFAPSSDFVVSLDKLDEHGGAGGGEPAVVYVEGDLTDPESVAAMDAFVTDLRGLDSEHFGRDDNGDVRIEGGVLEVLSDVVASPEATAAVSATSGTQVTDGDGDGYPDGAAETAAVYDATLETGVPLDAERMAWTPDDVGQVLWVSDDGATQATMFEVFLAGSREQETIAAAEEELEPLMSALETRLQAVDPAATAVLTGAPIARQHSLEAISRALQVSLPIAIVLCLLIAAAFMRSFRYAVVSIVPIILVVAWLYAFMYAFGFNINLVTATIGAISIGIGIDYAIHFTMRYREEMQQAPTRDEALRASGRHTGLALAASALSSVVGFGILAFAPMPMFASYGLLTAVMIVMALAASLLVLPSLLAVVTRDPGPPAAATVPAARPRRRPRGRAPGRAGV